MRYRKLGQTGAEVSALGLGCMRFPTIQDGEKRKIDEEQAFEMIKYAYENGVNYYDTAYTYHDGESETFLGEALKRLGVRDKVYIADKSPLWLVNSPEDFDRIFDEQLNRLQTDYIDFYLLHSMCKDYWDKTKKFDILEKCERLKSEGKIRHFGFSFHDEFDVFKEIVDSYDKWEFCQIQFNYADTKIQAGLKGLEYAAGKGLGVVIMEPIKGGKLADPAAHIKEALGGARTPVESALDFVWNYEEVSLLLSGMSDMDQLKENIRLADKSAPESLTEAEQSAIMKAGELFNSATLVQCTGCRYCTPCPGGLDIPEIFSIYNKSGLEYTWEGDSKKEYDKLPVRADSCLTCGKCEDVCPQSLPIVTLMGDIDRRFNGR